MSSRPIVRQEIKQRRWSVAWWSLGIVLYNLIVIASYSSLKSQMASLAKTFNQLPKSLSDLFAGGLDFVSPAGFMSGKMYYLILPMLFSVMAIGIGASLVGREEKQRSLELLLARPVSRQRLLLAKALAGMVVFLLVSVVVLAATLGLCKVYGVGLPLGNIAFAHLAIALFAILLGSLAFCLTAWGGLGRSSAIALSSLVGLGGYLMDSMSNDAHWLRVPAKLLPFHYLPTNAGLTGDFRWADLAGLFAASLILLLLSVLGFRRRDID
jgi:ABC-2 type transport system permease protein